MNISTVNKSIVLITRLLDDKKPVKPIYTTAPQKPNFIHTVKPNVVRVTPESCGIESEKIRRFLNTVSESRDLNTHSVIIGRQGKICCEATFNNNRLDVLKQTFSQCKSILALAVGIAVEKELLTLDTKIIDIFPDDCNAIVRIKLKDLTVKHLLTMSSGVLFNEIECMTETNWVKSYLRSITDNAPGKKFNYNSLNSYMLSAALCKITGTSLSNFLDENLFSPLGIKDFYWEKCPNGFEKGGWGLYISPYDMFKIATLVLNDGVFENRQIINKEFLKEACSKQISTPNSCGSFDYGYHIWVTPDEECFLFNGMFGQNVICFKKSKIVVLSNAGNNEMFQQNSYYDTVLNTFRGDFPSKVKENFSENLRLKRAVKNFSNPQKAKFSIIKIFKNFNDRKLAKELNGVTFSTNRQNSLGIFPVILQAVQNCYSSGLKEISFKYAEKHLNFTYKEEGATYNIPVGLNKPITSTQSFFGDPYLISCVGRFLTDEDFRKVLVIDVNFLETPCTKRIKVVFDKDFSILYQSENPGKPIIDLTLNSFKSSLLSLPVLSSLLEKVDEDAATYKIERLFAPRIFMQQK